MSKGIYLVIQLGFSALFFSPVSGQSVPPLDSLLSIFEKNRAAVCAAQLAEFSEKQPPLWHELLPGIGLAYTPAGKPRPAVSFSLSAFLSASRHRREREQKKAALAQSCAAETGKLRAEIRRLHRQAQNLEAEISEENRIFQDIERPLFEFFEKKAAALEILPVEFLKIKLAHEQAREADRRRRADLENLVFQLFEKIS